MVFSTEKDTGGQCDSTMHHYDRLELAEHKVSSIERDNGGQYDTTTHHYDRLELVEHKDGEISNPHYYNVSIQDGNEKSKYDGIMVSLSNKDKQQHDNDTGGQNDSTSNHYDRLEEVERKGTCELLNPCYYDEKNRDGTVKSKDDAKTKPLPDTDEEEQDYARGGQYDPSTNHYDRLELVVERKEAHEVSTQHDHDEKNRDSVKSKDDAKTTPPPDTDEEEHKYETCTVPKKPLSANSDTKAGVRITDSVPIQKRFRDHTFNDESVTTPECKQIPSENNYDRVDGVKDTTDAYSHRIPSKETIIHDIENETNQKQVPEYAVVDKTKKTSRMKHDENSCTDPTGRSDHL